jgi:hypothetical protein
MKDKIYNYVGEIVFLTIKFGLAIGVCILISFIVFESQKEDMFFQVMRYFNAAYDVKVEELYNNLGVVDEDDVDQDDWSYTITSVADKKERPKILEDIGDLCVNKHFPENPNKVTQTNMDDARQCIRQQVKDAIVISKVYLDQTDELEDGTTKTILMAVIVGCNKNNTNNGVIDFTNTLECIRKQVDLISEQLDTEITRLERKEGI